MKTLKYWKNKKIKKPKVLKKEPFIHEVIRCWDSNFHGIECLENYKQYGFQRNPCDYRPSNRIWIDKEDAQRLWELFA